MKKLLMPVLLSAALCACSGAGQGSYEKSKAPSAPDFTLPTVDGGSFKLSQARGKVVLLEFMSSHCPACDGANAPLAALYAKYSAKGLVVAAISLDSDSEVMSSYARNYGIAYPIALDTRQEVAATYRVRGTPTFLFVDKQGKIRRYWAGFAESLLPPMENAIQQFLQEAS